MPTKIKNSSVRLENKNAMSFFSSNILAFLRKTTFQTTSMFRPDINLTSSNWAENRPFSFDLHFVTVERRKVISQPAYCRTIPYLKKGNFKNIRLI